MRSYIHSGETRGPKTRPQPLTEREREALVRQCLSQGEALMSQAFKLANAATIIKAQLRERELVVNEAKRRQNWHRK